MDRARLVHEFLFGNGKRCCFLGRNRLDLLHFSFVEILDILWLVKKGVRGFIEGWELAKEGVAFVYFLLFCNLCLGIPTSSCSLDESCFGFLTWNRKLRSIVFKQKSVLCKKIKRNNLRTLIKLFIFLFFK